MSCPSNCTSCNFDNNQLNCLECETPLFALNGQCVPCGTVLNSNCTQCSLNNSTGQISCIACPNGQFVSENALSCIACENAVSQCSQCFAIANSSVPQCTQCLDGYFANKAGTTCTPCGNLTTNCSGCSTFALGPACTACSNGSILASNGNC